MIEPLPPQLVLMPRGPWRIVAIDYDSSLAQRLLTAFQAPEYDFHWFSDGREALSSLPEILPDVIVCDLLLPGLDGRAILRAVKSSPALSGIPFLVLSRARSEATIRATLNAGAHAFLVKPCPVSQIKQAIQRVLAERPLRRDAARGKAPRSGRVAHTATGPGLPLLKPEEQGPNEGSSSTSVARHTEPAITPRRRRPPQRREQAEQVEQAAGAVWAAPQDAMPSALRRRGVVAPVGATAPIGTGAMVRVVTLEDVEIPASTPPRESVKQADGAGESIPAGALLTGPSQTPESRLLAGVEEGQPRESTSPGLFALDAAVLDTGEAEKTPGLPGEILSDAATPSSAWRLLPRAAAALLPLGLVASVLKRPPETPPVPARLAPAHTSAQGSQTTAAEPTPAASVPGSPATAEAAAVPLSRPAAVAELPRPQPPGGRSETVTRGRLEWARALYEKGRLDDARAALSDLLNLDPSNAEARELATLLDGAVSGVVSADGAEGVPVEERGAVIALLGRYVRAFEQGDLNGLMAIWPGVDPKTVPEQSNFGRPGHWGLRLVDLEVKGDEAVALCVAYEDMLVTDGRKTHGTSRVRFQLRRINGSWIVNSVN